MSVREVVQDARDSLAVARGALEDAKPRAGTRVAGCVKEALEELDYVEEAMVTVEKASRPQFSKGGSAIYDWLSDMEHSGEWEKRVNIEKLATEAAWRWEQQRNNRPRLDMVQFDVPLHSQPQYIASVTHAPPISQQLHTYRILIPTVCRDKYQAKYIAQRQLEEAYGL